MANLVERLDTQLATVLSDWSITTTFLALGLAFFLVYPIIFSAEPDTHPLLLARQVSINPVRNKGESALYRSPEVPHGYPLKTGLGVKDAGAPRWAVGKDGDLRDVWREVQRGGSKDSEGKELSKGKIMTVFGREEVTEHDVKDLSKEIEIMGKHFRENGVKRVAIYLPNSVEFLMTVFACSFYGLTPILLPYNLPHPKVYELIHNTSADALICAAGNLPLDNVVEQCQNLRLLTWVVEATSRHMDWNGVPDSAQGRLNVSVWHDVVQEKRTQASGDLPTNEKGDTPGDVVAISQPMDVNQEPSITTFTQANFAAAIAALISALPLRQRFTGSDLVLLASSFNIQYVLCQTMAALYTHASLAITSVAEPGVDLTQATRGVAPTVIIASAETMAASHAKESANIKSVLKRLGMYNQSRTLASGRMPTGKGLLFRLLAPSSSATGNAPGTLRLILTSHRLGAGSPPLTSSMLSDLRIFTRARICYALTAPGVAGAVAQSHVFDYRTDHGQGSAHFGLPLSSVEVKLLNSDDQQVDGHSPEGDILVTGPAVSGNVVKLGAKGKFREDGTLALL